jgi:hypothetical protein
LRGVELPAASALPPPAQRRAGRTANAAWLEIILAAADLVAWAKLIGFAHQPDIARCEIATFRDRVLRVATAPPAPPANSGFASTPPGVGP